VGLLCGGDICWLLSFFNECQFFLGLGWVRLVGGGFGARGAFWRGIENDLWEDCLCGAGLGMTCFGICYVKIV
jgi:hypothetical protein